MHPADVAEYVALSVELLRERLATRSDLAASEPLLDGEVYLLVPFTLRTHQADAVQAGKLYVPGGTLVVPMRRIVDLSAVSTDRSLLLAMDLTDYDGQPPTAELLLPDRSPLPAAEWPNSLDLQGVICGHRDYDRPWFCRPGLREFHSHPQHDDQPWDAYREGLPLHTIVENLLYDLTHRFISR